MQQFKNKFKNLNVTGETIGNIQSCIRLNDYDITGDGTHFLMFNMIGLFSFRDMTVKETIDFWLEFLKNELSLIPDWVTIHPDKIKEWKCFYPTTIEVREDAECIWSDGEMGGYCTEFYYKGIEIGNIVNCNGDSIDVGFGLERLDSLINNTHLKSRVDNIKDCVWKIIDSGYYPSPNNQGHILRKLLTELIKSNEQIDHKFYHDEVIRRNKIIQRYNRIKDKHQDKSPEWWFDTHGVDIKEIKNE